MKILDKKAIEFTPSPNELDKCVKDIENIVRCRTDVDLVLLNLSSKDYPNGILSVPENLKWVLLGNSKVKILWDCEEGSIKEADNHLNIDLTLVSSFYDASINPLRKDATKKAIFHWFEQHHLPAEIIFIELGFNGVFTFTKQDFPGQVQYIRINGDDSNKYLFQKEHLWNIAAKMAKYQKIMFLDSDFSPMEDVDWFKKVYDSLDKCLFTQGFRKGTYLDCQGNPTKLSKSTYGHNLVNTRLKWHKCGLPGGCFCVRKQFLEDIGWFNNIPCGGGDTLLWNELLGMTRTRQWIIELVKREKIQQLVKKYAMEKHIDALGDVDVELFHFYHGDISVRSYRQRDYMWASQYPWIGRIIQLDSNGILKWVDTKHYFYRALTKFHTINDDVDKAAKMLSDNVDYAGFVRELDARVSILNCLNKARIENIISDLRGKYEIDDHRCCIGRTIVTMTSYPKRIKNCNRVIDLILKQKFKPDVIYLNLSTSEFPNRVFDLPGELVDFICKNPVVKINWVSGPNTKTMKKVFPILDLVNDDDLLIVTDDDVLFNNENIIGTWRRDFIKNDGKCAIVGNDRKAGGLEGMYMACGDMICQKKMLANNEAFMIPEILNTYHDDRFYISLFWLNGVRTAPVSRFLMKKSKKEDIDYGFNGGDGMTKTNQYTKSADFDKVFRPLAEKIYGKQFDALFGVANNS